jgi:hypothetical protein
LLATVEKKINNRVDAGLSDGLRACASPLH